MIKILYIGNDLKREAVNTSIMRTLGPNLEAEGYTLYYTSPKSNQLWRLLDMLWSVFKYRNRVDVLFIDTYSTLNFYYAFFVSQLARLLKLPYIPILHGGNLVNRLHTNPLFSKLVFQNSRLNISPSLFLKQEFERFNYKNLEFIPNAITLENYQYVQKDYDTPHLLWVRSFDTIYNPKQAIYVVDQLKKRGFKSSLTMVGPDSDGSLESLRSLAQDLKLDVTFTGKLPRAEWIDLSKDHNLFINTTTVDNMPVSVIEAMALGFPIVSTNVGGMPYLMQQGKQGILVQSANVDAMADAIISLFQEPDRLQQMSENSRSTATQFDWQQVKHLWFDVLDRLNSSSSTDTPSK